LKKELRLALKLAKSAVDIAPSEYIPWEILVELYVELGDHKTVLLGI
jgi:Tfp pilus assembly protein PilF